jgi:hypothetical protein
MRWPVGDVFRSSSILKTALVWIRSAVDIKYQRTMDRGGQTLVSFRFRCPSSLESAENLSGRYLCKGVSYSDDNISLEARIEHFQLVSSRRHFDNPLLFVLTGVVGLQGRRRAAWGSIITRRTPLWHWYTLKSMVGGVIPPVA